MASTLEGEATAQTTAHSGNVPEAVAGESCLNYKGVDRTDVFSLSCNCLRSRMGCAKSRVHLNIFNLNQNYHYLTRVLLD